MGAENRTELLGTYTGTIAKFVDKQGWGFVEPDDVSSLPAEATEALEKAKTEAEAKGKSLANENLIYFRKPDADQDLFPLKRDDPVGVTFELYMDDKGVGAHAIVSA